MDWEPRGAWKTVVAIGRLARQQNAASCDAAFLAGELDQISLKRSALVELRTAIADEYQYHTQKCP